MQTNNETNNFAAAVAVAENAQNHAQEIQRTRIGGLGGSDANILLKIAEKGLAGLSATDMKRLCIMTGQCEPDEWTGNAYTNAGHAFEDYAEKTLPFGVIGYEREKVIEQRLALNFKTFAHADFVTGKERLDVVECKYVQDNTARVAAKYAAQLQWYYVLGAKSVTLCHGWGDVEPFAVAECELLKIERDEATIDMLLQGVKLLDDALASGWRPEPQDKEILQNTPRIVQDAFFSLAEIRSQEKEIAEKKPAAALILQEYMERWGFAGIVAGDGSKAKVIYNKPGVAKSFNAEEFLKDHPEYKDQPRYWKTITRKASVTFK